MLWRLQKVANASHPTQMFTRLSVHWEAGWNVLTYPSFASSNCTEVEGLSLSLFSSFSFPVFLPLKSMTWCITRGVLGRENTTELNLW